MTLQVLQVNIIYSVYSLVFVGVFIAILLLYNYLVTNGFPFIMFTVKVKAEILFDILIKKI